MGSFKFGILETFLVLLLPRPLRIHNVVLCLYVLSPKVQGDASMVVETTMRSVEIAMDACKSKGIAPPTKMILWESWFCFSKVYLNYLILKAEVRVMGENSG